MSKHRFIDVWTRRKKPHPQFSAQRACEGYVK